MQQGAANPVTEAARKTDFACPVDESNSTKECGVVGINLNSQCRQRCQSIGHDAFAAGLVDGRLRAIDNRNLKASLAGSDCSCESGGASTGNQNFCASQVAHVTSAIIRVPSRIPDPSRRECCNCPQQDGAGS